MANVTGRGYDASFNKPDYSHLNQIYRRICLEYWELMLREEKGMGDLEDIKARKEKLSKRLERYPN